MLLKNKVAVVYGAYGNVGSTVARAYAEHGARVFLTGRNASRLETLRKQISGQGGQVEMDVVDACDEASVDKHLDSVVQRAGKIDVSFNSSGIPQKGIQGLPLTDLPLDSFMAPLRMYPLTHFITAKHAARRMLGSGGGVILIHTPEPAKNGAPLIGGMGPAWAALEVFVRNLSAEFASKGIRAIGLRTTGLPETSTITEVFGLHAAALGIAREQFQSMMESMAQHRRSTRLSELAKAAVFAASDFSEGFYGTVLNLTAGKSSD